MSEPFLIKETAKLSDIIEITDFEDPKLDVYARTKEIRLLNRANPEDGIFIAESPKVVERALDAYFYPCLDRPEAGDRERRTFAGIRAGYQTQLWYYDCPSTVLNLLEEFERELESDPVIFQFIEPDEGGDVEDMVTETVSDFSVAGFDWHP